MFAFNSLQRWVAWLLLAAALALPGGVRAAAAAGTATPDKRIALVIGNARYNTIPLNNPENDAHLIAARLRTLGFDVNEQLNLGVREFRRVLRDYARRVQEEPGVSVLYYAGHGVQIDGRNYLLPVDINLRDEEEVKDESVDIDELFMSRIDRARSSARIVILDACRDNPFGARTRNIKAGGGLAEMAARGALIAYASAPGAAAEDGPSGTNSIYSKHLADEMMKEGLEVEQMFKNVRVKVLRDTKERQVPWVNTSLTVNFSFNPSSTPASVLDDSAQRERIKGLEAELARTQQALEAARQQPGAVAVAPSANVATPAAAVLASPAAAVATAAPAVASPAPYVAAPTPPTSATAVASATPSPQATASQLELQLERARKALDEARAASRANAALSPTPAASTVSKAASVLSQRTVNEPRRPAGAGQRCAELLGRVSVGDTIGAEDESFLLKECR